MSNDDLRIPWMIVCLTIAIILSLWIRHAWGEPNVEAVTQRVIDLTGLPKKDFKIVVLDKHREVVDLYEKTGGKKQGIKAFYAPGLRTIFIYRAASAKLLAHEITHALLPPLPKQIEEVIPEWVQWNY